MPLPFRPGDRRAARLRRRRALRSATGALVLCAGLALPTAVSNGNGEGNGGGALATLSALTDQPDFGEEFASAHAAGQGGFYVSDQGRGIVAEKGGRVAPRRLAAVQPRFAAGRVGAVSGLLRPGMALGDDEMRTALAGPQPFTQPIQVAGSFRDPSQPIEIAAVVPVPAPARSRIAATIDAASKVDASAPSLAAMAAYASAGASSTASLFDNVLAPKPDGPFVPPIGGKDHAWAAATLPPSVYTKSEQTCLATAIYFEARGESEEGQAAVAQVILNRVRNPTYPKTVCGVVYQNANWRNRCQFSFACDGIKDVIWNRRAYGTAERIADDVTKGRTWIPEVGSATHYHASYVRPRWAKAMEKVDKIGLHVFYRTFNGGWN